MVCQHQRLELKLKSVYECVDCGKMLQVKVKKEWDSFDILCRKVVGENWDQEMNKIKEG